MVHVGDVLLDFGIHQRLGRDAQRQRHHFEVDVADFAVLPAVEHAVRQPDHVRPVTQQLLAGEGGRGEPPVLLPVLAFGGEDALPEQGGDMPPDHPVLDEVAMVLDQDMLDVVGIVEKHRRPAGEIVADDVAEAQRGLRHETELVAPELQQIAENGNAFGAGRPVLARRARHEVEGRCGSVFRHFGTSSATGSNRADGNRRLIPRQGAVNRIVARRMSGGRVTISAPA